MSEQEALDFARESIFVLLKLGLPIMMVGLIVGLTIAIFQALTQIQEMTLTFVPKIIVVFLSMLVFLPWMMDVLFDFMALVADHIINIQ
ncbi:flagellar biosynthesis protein FliQ [Aestuariispira insulae]|uniref:Flagellar biosynthetic protein FliQ n=1 Tax=Aestuariispira insulae TaxID=1461337 RepID=A0A3D9HUB5_9PROT|nr:flagellar biosynthesis protein FliQ [Aestuariispira insulae]RED52476.1 flagellar biosynthetic protein FliQ [Aestuariispira insulae]